MAKRFSGRTRPGRADRVPAGVPGFDGRAVRLQAAGLTHGLSDLDVAVLFNKGASKERKRRLLNELTVSITDATGFEAIDVVDLAAVGPELGYEVLSEGTVLLGDKDEIVEFEAELLVRKLDFAPVKTEWIAALDERIEDGTYGRA